MEKTRILIAAAILIGSIISSYIIANAIIQTKLLNRVVSVKGMTERDVKADQVNWNIPFTVTSDDLTDANTQIQIAIVKVMDFLKENKINPEEIALGSTVVKDRKSQEYISEGADKAKRYILESEILVKSEDVDKIEQTNKNIITLIAQGVVVSYNNWGVAGPRYIFTKLNSIKPQMLAEATSNARQAATEFAKNSGSKVGKIASANQGMISILPASNFYSKYTDSNNEESSPLKTVRVVTSIDFYLEN